SRAADELDDEGVLVEGGAHRAPTSQASAIQVKATTSTQTHTSAVTHRHPPGLMSMSMGFGSSGNGGLLVELGPQVGDVERGQAPRSPVDARRVRHGAVALAEPWAMTAPPALVLGLVARKAVLDVE